MKWKDKITEPQRRTATIAVAALIFAVLALGVVASTPRWCEKCHSI